MLSRPTFLYLSQSIFLSYKLIHMPNFTWSYGHFQYLFHPAILNSTPIIRHCRSQLFYYLFNYSRPIFHYSQTNSIFLLRLIILHIDHTIITHTPSYCETPAANYITLISSLTILHWPHRSNYHYSHFIIVRYVSTSVANYISAADFYF